MKTKEITEKMLLDNVSGITNGGDYISSIDNREIRWHYRTKDEHGQPETVCELANREVITLEWDRYGIIEIDHANDSHPGLELLDKMEKSLWGNSI